ncbi:MAG: PKD domain-containing protein [Phycisphaerae bacterium]
MKPHRCNPMRLTLLVGLVVSVLAAPAGAAPAWWDLKWPFRRLITVPQPDQGRLGGQNIAVATFPTAGTIRPDAADIRVVSARGNLMDHRVLQVGPGDQVRIALATDGRESTYYVYTGNESAKAPGKQLQIRRGVLLETWAHRGYNPNSLQQAEKLLARADKLLGRDLRTQIALGHNPFGPQSSVAQRLTGWFVAPAAGEYTFAVASRNASFVLINDQLLLDNGGSHRAQRDVSVRKSIRLAAGLHKISVLHVSNSGDPILVVAWKPAGTDQFAPMPPGAFAGFAESKPGPLERYGRASGVDFVPDHAGESWINDTYYQRYRFEALLVGRRVEAKWQWDFGDGQSSDKPLTEHVYLLPGTYTVTLTARTGVGQLRRTNRIVVTRPWDRVTRNDLDRREAVGQIVAGYDFAALSAAANAHAVLLLAETGQDQAAQAAGSALIARDKAPGDLLAPAAMVYAEKLLAAGQADQAAAALLQAAKIADAALWQAQLTNRAGRIVLSELHRPDRAAEIFQQSIDRFFPAAGADALRVARVGLADSYRAQGLRDKAIAAYAQAGPRIPPAQRSEAIYRGDLARHVEAYINGGKFAAAREYLQQWADDLPADKIDGYWSWMAVRLALAGRNYDEAIREAEILTTINVQSNYGAKLLMLARQAAIRAGKPAKGDALLQRIIKTFPESPLADEARRLLQIQNP